MIRECSSLLSAIVERHAAMREMRVSDKNSPWIASELKSLVIAGDRQISNYDAQLYSNS